MRFSPHRSALLAAALVAAIASAGVLTGCDSADLGATPATAPAVAASADGEALLRGLLFGQGEAAEVLPEVWGTPDAKQAIAALTPEMRGQQDALIAALYEADPAFFDRFEREMTSGDLHRVDAAVRQANERLAAATPTSAREQAGDGGLVLHLQRVCGHQLICPPPYVVIYAQVTPKMTNDLFLAEESAALRREELVGYLTERLARTR